jgi:hypothetical protein
MAYERLELARQEACSDAKAENMNAQFSQMACSQHGSLRALTASLLQLAHRSLCGISSGANELSPVSILHPSNDETRSRKSILDQLSLSLRNGRGHVANGSRSICARCPP